MASFASSPRDRTQEFASLVSMYQNQLASSASAAPRARVPLPPPPPPPPQRVAHSQFAEAAKAINNGITSVATKLQDLTRMAKGTSLFNDQTTQIQELTAICKQDIHLLNDEVEALERWIEHGSGGGGGDLDDMRGQSKSHSQQVVSNLKTQLAQQARQFAHVLTLRTKNLKEQSNRRKQFSSGSSLPLRKRPQLTDTASAAAASSSDFDDSQDSSQPQTQYQVMLEDQSGEQYLASRAAAVQEIESTIQELATMYQRLAILVKQQEEQAVRLDLTVEETLHHTESAYDQLQKYYEWVQGNRWLMFKVFAILIAFAVIFVMFIQ